MTSARDLDPITSVPTDPDRRAALSGFVRVARVGHAPARDVVALDALLASGLVERVGIDRVRLTARGVRHALRISGWVAAEVDPPSIPGGGTPRARDRLLRSAKVTRTRAWDDYVLPRMRRALG